jgi:hypothetical protein
VSYSPSDAAQDARRAEEVLTEAFNEAEALVDTFVTDLGGSDLQPVASVRLATGAGDQPVFAFELLVDLDDDLEADDYPVEQIGQLRDEFRSRITSSRVDDWDWIVNTGTKAGAAAG